MKTAISISRDIISQAVIDKILSRTDKTGECLIWRGSTSKLKSGYGRITINNRCYGVHRVIFTWFKRALFDKEIVMHSCDNPLCCNHEHMSGGTQLDNVRDMIAKKRDRKAVTKKGGENPRAALTNKQAKWIRDNYKPGPGEMSGMSIAKKLNISPGCIYRVLRGERYKEAT